VAFGVVSGHTRKQAAGIRCMPIILKENPKPAAKSGPQPPGVEYNQRRRMLVALALLLFALIVILIKDSYWLGSHNSAETTPGEPSNSQQAATPILNSTPPTVSETALPSVPSTEKKTKTKPLPVPAVSRAEQPAAAEPGTVITATNRTVLPPLEVEVVAGNQHRPLPSSTNSVKVEMQSAPEPTAPAQPEPVEESARQPNMTTQVTMPPTTAQRVSRSVQPSYPTLARQMKVQGAVVLQVLIDKSGNIEELHVISGPSILASAAQQALRQWHFKPYYQTGQPVETEARVTVNFTISTY